MSKLKAHLAKRGFGDIEVNVSGGYGPTRPTRTAADQGEQATLAAPKYRRPCRRVGRKLAGRDVHRPPLRMAAGQFGGGRGGGAHAPDEWLLIDSSNPKVLGFDGRRSSTPTSSTRCATAREVER